MWEPARPDSPLGSGRWWAQPLAKSSGFGVRPSQGAPRRLKPLQGHSTETPSREIGRGACGAGPRASVAAAGATAAWQQGNHTISHLRISCYTLAYLTLTHNTSPCLAMSHLTLPYLTISDPGSQGPLLRSVLSVWPRPWPSTVPFFSLPQAQALGRVLAAPSAEQMPCVVVHWSRSARACQGETGS